MRKGLLLLAGLLALAGCGDLPQPFAGRPGATAQALLAPPPARLAVPVPEPSKALLPAAAATAYAGAITDALVAREVPAVAGPVRRGDWRLDVAAERGAGVVTPVFTVDDPDGKPQGSVKGPPVPADAWSGSTPDALRQEAASAGGLIADLLTQIEAIRRRSDPNSLVNRAPRVAVPDVTGAPGDGNRSLALELRRLLPQQGEMVQATPQGADFTVAGTVHTSPGPNDTMQVDIEWHITDAAGHDLGKVVQLNDVPQGTLDGHWGDVALAVAQEAAGGIKQVIDKQTGAAASAPPAGTAGTTVAAPPAGVAAPASPGGTATPAAANP